MKEGARGGTMGSPAIDEDPLCEEVLELSSGVLHEIGSRLKGREPEGSRALGVW